jgi:hypothetical protein
MGRRFLVSASVFLLLARVGSGQEPKASPVDGWLKQLRSGKEVVIKNENGSFRITAGEVKGQRLLRVCFVYNDKDGFVVYMGRADEGELLLDQPHQRVNVLLARVDFFARDVQAFFEHRVWPLALPPEP